MLREYSNFKTPYYEIKVGDSIGNRMVSLPHQILRLIEKVEITEALEQNKIYTASIVINEGSREPAARSAFSGTEGLYQVPNGGNEADASIAGSFTNRTGLIFDLRFSGNKGITFTTASELKNSKVGAQTETEVQAGTTTRYHKRENVKPTFLFQARNLVSITWGYKEDPATVRSIVLRILIINTEFPEMGMPRTTIVCQSERVAIDALVPRKGVAFGDTVVNSNGVQSKKDIPVSKLLNDICDKLSIDRIISPIFSNELLDKDREKSWTSSESFDQFLRRLAENHSAYYDFILSPKTLKPTLIFIRKSDFESKTLPIPQEYLTYKSPQSIIKSLSISADFGMIQGAANAGMDDNGNIINTATEDGQVEISLFAGEKHVDLSPLGSNPVPLAQSIASQIATSGVTGRLEVIPNNQGEGAFTEDAKVKARAAVESAVKLDMQTLGYTRFTPGVVNIQGIGVRYSGRYRLISIAHTLDSSGYHCKITGTTYTDFAGFSVGDTAKGIDNKEQQVSAQLFKGKPTTLDNFRKFIYQK